MKESYQFGASSSERIKVIAFDWDGTLFDSMGVKPKNLARLIAKEFGVEAEAVEKRYREISGVPRARLIRRLVSDCCGIALDESGYGTLSRKFTEENILVLKKHSVFSEVRASVEALSKHYILYISSASVPEELRSIVGTQEINHNFYEVWGSENGFNKGREHFERMMIQQSCGFDEILFVGDDSMDESLAREAGVSFVRIFRDSAQYSRYSGSKIRSLGELCGSHL